MAENKIILGIDPGTLIMGYGIIETTQSNIKLITMGIIELKKIKKHFDRLLYIYQRIEMLIKEFNPQEVAIEAPFYGKNVQSMLKLGRAQGIAIAAALSQQCKVFEYSPRKIKQSLTGNGNASKEQVSKMLKHLLKFEENPIYFDATDALAAAVCHLFQNNLSSNTNKITSWKSFIQKNKHRIQ